MFSKLVSQELFEGLLKEPVAPIVIVYFTAKWCGACKQIDWSQVKTDGIKWFVCDVDENDYTPGFCGVRSIPSFQAIINGKCVPLFVSNSAADINAWVSKLKK